MENFQERLIESQDLHRMLDTVANQKKEEIASGKEFAVDIIKHDSVTFNIKQNDQDIEVTQTVYEVLFEKDGELYHEFYNDQGELLCPPISDKDYQEGKKIEELGLASFKEGSLISAVYKDQNSKSLSEIENEQIQEVAKVLEMEPKDVKEMNIVEVDTAQKTNTTKDEQVKKAQEELKKYTALGIEIDTNELATSDDTIKEFLNIDASNLLLLQVNGDWRVFDISDGSLKPENNLQVTASKQSFTTIDRNGNEESRTPEIEFRRKDNPNYSLAIDSNNEENRTQTYLIVGESRTATELETTSAKSPYAEAKNNELMQEAQRNPDKKDVSDDDEDKDPHEPDVPDERSLGPKNIF